MIRLIRGTAILALLSLALNGCDSGTKPKSDDPGLLTDEELVTEEDPNAPEENPDWVDWIVENNVPIRSLESESFSDLRALTPYLADKRIVQLGESSHGVGEFSKAKVRLIRFLHEELGFDVIAFESGLFDCYYANTWADSLSSTDMMTNSIFGIWRCTEVRPLFEYIKETRTGDRPLTLAGFDIQISSPTVGNHRPDFFREVLKEVDTGFADHIYNIDDEFARKFRDRSFITSKRHALVADYEALADSIDLHRDALMAAFSGFPDTVLIAGQAAYNNGQVYGITAAKSGSIESVFYRARRKHCYIDMLRQEESAGNSWMFRRITAKDMGIGNVTLVPRDQYDAIFFVDTVHPPDYLTAAAGDMISPVPLEP